MAVKLVPLSGLDLDIAFLEANTSVLVEDLANLLEEKLNIQASPEDLRSSLARLIFANRIRLLPEVQEGKLCVGIHFVSPPIQS